METFDWGKIYLQNADLVYRFLLSRCHDKYLAEDLTSETFLQAHRCQNRYNGACKLSVWLCQIEKHLLYQHYEKQKRQEETTEGCLRTCVRQRKKPHYRMRFRWKSLSGSRND